MSSINGFESWKQKNVRFISLWNHIHADFLKNNSQCLNWLYSLCWMDMKACIGLINIIPTIIIGKMEMVLPAIHIMNRFMGICFNGPRATSHDFYEKGQTWHKTVRLQKSCASTYLNAVITPWKQYLVQPFRSDRCSRLWFQPDPETLENPSIPEVPRFLMVLRPPALSVCLCTWKCWKLFVREKMARLQNSKPRQARKLIHTCSLGVFTQSSVRNKTRTTGNKRVKSNHNAFFDRTKIYSWTICIRDWSWLVCQVDFDSESRPAPQRSKRNWTFE